MSKLILECNNGEIVEIDIDNYKYFESGITTESLCKAIYKLQKDIEQLREMISEQTSVS